jgi:hypothetical protein
MAVGFLNRTFALALELSGALELLKHPRLVLDFGARHFHAQFIVLSAFAVGASLIFKASGWRLGGLASVGEGAVEGHLGDVVDAGFHIPLCHPLQMEGQSSSG